MVCNAENFHSLYITLFNTGIRPYIGIGEDSMHVHVTCKHQIVLCVRYDNLVLRSHRLSAEYGKSRIKEKTRFHKYVVKR